MADGNRLSNTTLRLGREPIQSPPRLTGDYAQDQGMFQTWMQQVYASLRDSGMADPAYQLTDVDIDLAALPDPGLTTIGRSQKTANLAHGRLATHDDTLGSLDTRLDTIESGFLAKGDFWRGTIGSYQPGGPGAPALVSEADPTGLHNGTDRIIIKKPGDYLVHAQQLISVPAAADFYFMLRKNGATQKHAWMRAGSMYDASVSSIIPMAAGDYFDLFYSVQCSTWTGAHASMYVVRIA